MIRMNDQALFMCFPDGRMEPLDLTALVGEIASQNQTLSPNFEPWMVEHVVQSIVHYVRHQLNKDSVTLQDFIEIAQEVLKTFIEESESKPPEPHQENFDLYQLAQRAGHGFELRFYEMLRENIRDAAGRGKTAYVFTGLRRCVKLLAGKQRWRIRCRRLNDEIVEFIRHTTGRCVECNVRLTVSS